MVQLCKLTSVRFRTEHTIQRVGTLDSKLDITERRGADYAQTESRQALMAPDPEAGSEG